MSPTGIICAMLIVAGFPLVHSFNLHINELLINKQLRLMNDNVYAFGLTGLHGENFSMLEYKGYTLIIINLPFNCDPKRIFILNMLLTQYYDRGLRIIAFPTEEFSRLYPLDRFLSLSIIRRYVSRYQMNFDVYDKVQITGPEADPLWRYLKASLNYYNSEVIEDYTMFIVDKSGHPVLRIPGDPLISYEKLYAVMPRYF